MKGVADNELSVQLSVHVEDVMEMLIAVEHYSGKDEGDHEFWTIRIGPAKFFISGGGDALHTMLGRINIAFATPREAGS